MDRHVAPRQARGLELVETASLLAMTIGKGFIAPIAERLGVRLGSATNSAGTTSSSNINGKKDHRIWGIKPRSGVGSFANQSPKHESAPEYENENFRTRRRTWASVACALRGLWCNRPARWLRIRTVFGGRVLPTACSPRCGSRHRGYVSGSRSGEPARPAIDRSDRAEPGGWKLDRRHAAASRGAIGNAHPAPFLESCLDPWILDVE